MPEIARGWIFRLVFDGPRLRPAWLAPWLMGLAMGRKPHRVSEEER